MYFGRGPVLVPPVLRAPEPVSQYCTALQVQTMEGDLPRRHEGATTAGEYDERHICIYQDLSLHQDRLACGAGLDKLWLRSYDVASQELVSQSAPERARVRQNEQDQVTK